MADFNAHIKQAKKNCLILAGLNTSVPESWDWQVTASFYIAVHLVNAHIAKQADLHYKSHEAVKNALFRDGKCKIDESIYLSYQKLEGLSRRARYLCHEKPDTDLLVEHLTHDRHLSKALKHLDALMSYMSDLHTISFDKIEIDCLDLKSASLNNFKYVGKQAAA